RSVNTYRICDRKKSFAFPGMEQLRLADTAEKVPTRNHTTSLCPTIQSPPVVSCKGFTEVGIERAHCHHSAVSVGGVGGVPVGGQMARFPGIINPRNVLSIAKPILCRLMILSLVQRCSRKYASAL